MARILVLGSRGFIGTHLTSTLRERGHEVYGADLMHAADDHYQRCDIREYRQLRALMWQEWDYVYNLSAEFGRANGEDSYEQMWATNVIGLKHLLLLQRESRFRLIHFSSSEIYGNWPAQMQEDVPTLHPLQWLNDYAMSKAVNEQQIRNHALTDATESVIVRIFNCYGPGEVPTPYRSALSRLIYAALTGTPFTIYSQHERSWLYVDDLVHTLANIPDRFKAGEVYNLGNPHSVSMDVLAALVLEATGADPGCLTYAYYEPMTTYRKLVDTEKAVHDLGHTLTVWIAEGISRTVAWQREHVLREEGIHA